MMHNEKNCSNTSPIRYLTIIGEQELLYELFGKILISKGVLQELINKNAPMIVQKFMQSPPVWIEICEVSQYSNPSLHHLDPGEREAILLVEQICADLLLIDDKKGRLTAKDRGLNITGVLGILELADMQKKVDFPKVIDKLLKTNIKVSQSLIKHMLISHPKDINGINELLERMKQEGLSCYIKPFLGYWDGKLYGQYKYKGACEGKMKGSAQCRTTLLLINPEGYIFRCHHDLFEADITKAIGSIFDSKVTLSEEFHACYDYGFCNPCDVQVKFVRFDNWDYCAVEIQKDGIIRNDDTAAENWGPFINSMDD